MSSILKLSCDVLVIGSGAAGLSLALRLAPHYTVIVLSKGLANESSTFYAQGGIAVAFDETDSIALHVEDTLNVGAGIVNKYTAEFVASNAHHCVQWLVDRGVVFDMQIYPNGMKGYHLAHEGGHSYRRIIHVSDATGKEIETVLIREALKHPNIQILEQLSAIDLITSDEIGLTGMRRVLGAWIWNRNKKRIEPFRAKMVVLATGGASRVYQHTTNPDVSSGDGIAIAWRAGCRVANLEFNQFHPTTLFHTQAHNFLLTEAMRGEGAWLKRPDGSRFMQDFDERGELAPRDIIVRAIDYEMKRLGVSCMYLDISHKPANLVRQHFPTIYKKLLELGMDLTKEPIPIVPAAHYTCGGIVVDNHGRTDINGLYAIGEVSYTGLHGANRIASNSLLECLVYGWSAAEDICKRIPSHIQYVGNLPVWNIIWNKSPLESTSESSIVRQNRKELSLLMWNCVGIVRTTKQLEYALKRISVLQQEVNEYYTRFCMSNDLLELRNIIQVAELIVRCAMMRKESRGQHYMIDYPKILAKSGPSILSPNTLL